MLQLFELSMSWKTFRSVAGFSFATDSVPSYSSVGKGMATGVEYPDGGVLMDCPSRGVCWVQWREQSGAERRHAEEFATTEHEYRFREGGLGNRTSGGKSESAGSLA
jgi:hypothetical protein